LRQNVNRAVLPHYNTVGVLGHVATVRLEAIHEDPEAVRSGNMLISWQPVDALVAKQAGPVATVPGVGTPIATAISVQMGSLSDPI
jgi:hypothetical protein